MNIKEILDAVQAFEIQSAHDLESFRIQFLGSKGQIKDLYGALKNVPNEDKKSVGQQINHLRQIAEDKLASFKLSFTDKNGKEDQLDLTRPSSDNLIGSHHPLSLVRKEIIEIFNRIGYVVSEGPEIEDDWHNFSALNFPPEHPARDMQDTFFVEKGENEMALRTHTSSVQVRVMENSTPPIRTISPGRVYRNEAISARAHCFFHQIEGLYIDMSIYSPSI